MRLDRLNYRLGPENIAGEPIEVRLGERDLGRMLVVDRRSRTIRHSAVRNLPDHLENGDVLILNDSKRVPGVLHLRTLSGAQIEFRLTQMIGPNECIARAFPTHFIKKGLHLTSRNNAAIKITRSEIGPHRLCGLQSEVPLRELLANEGRPITSFFYKNFWDIENYNPVYAKAEGSVESPMAGLHFTKRLLDELRSRGVTVGSLTLHVVGSWLPFFGKTTKGYIPQPEQYFIPAETAAAIAAAKKGNRRVIAVGTTVVRAIESAASADGRVRHGEGLSQIFIEPGFKFSVTDAYFTNFHPARSTLMALDAAFCPRPLLLEAYKHAQTSGYLFHEFGDAIFYT